MDFINEFFEQNVDTFTHCLADAGFPPALVRKFLPAVATEIFNSMRVTEADKTVAGLLSNEDNQVLSAINVHTLANELGISVEKTRLGLLALAPEMSRALSKKGYGIIGETTSRAWESRVDFISATNKYFFSQS